MSVEVANTIDQLNPSFPRNVDLIKEGDDHLRLIKQVLKTTLPNINKVVTISADKLNNLDKTFSATNANGDVTINGSVTMAANKTMNCGGNRLQNVSNPAAPQDAVTLAYAQSAAFRGQAWPVGSVYFTMSNQRPEQLLGVGTWVRIAAGRYIVGQGSDSDGRDSINFPNPGKTPGFYKSALVEGNLPPHSHRVVGQTQAAGNHTHPYRDRYYVEAETTLWRYPYREAIPGGTGYNGGAGSKGTDNDNDRWLYYDTNTSAAGNHQHGIDFQSQNTGGGARFDTYSPGFALYIWQRTA